MNIFKYNDVKTLAQYCKNLIKIVLAITFPKYYLLFHLQLLNDLLYRKFLLSGLENGLFKLFDKFFQKVFIVLFEFSKYLI